MYGVPIASFIVIFTQTDKIKTLHFVKANNRTRFEDLARQARLGHNGADLLRIINGYYPSGEPRPGEVIKIIQ